MKAADIMTTKVVTVAADATAQEAAAQMLRHRVSALPVVDQSGRLIGIVSEGDLMRRGELGTERERSWWLELLTSNRTLATDYAKAHGRKVSEVMSRKLIVAKRDTPINDIALLLEQHAIKRVPIVDNGKLGGEALFRRGRRVECGGLHDETHFHRLRLSHARPGLRLCGPCDQ